MPLQDKDEAYLQLRDACLNHFMIFGSKEMLLDALGLARILWYVYAALADRRLMIACDQAKFTASFQRHGRAGRTLREFLTACNAIDN